MNKLTEAQRQIILEAYVRDYREAVRIALSFGMCRSYPQALAYSRGIRTRRSSQRIKRIKRGWEKAIERGAICV